MKNFLYITSWIFLFLFILSIAEFNLRHDRVVEDSNPLVEIGSNLDTNKIINTYVNWRDLRNFYYSANLKILYDDYLKSLRNRDRSSASSLEWLYVDIFKSDYYDLDKVYQDLDYIRKDRSLSKKKFAEVVVAMVQHIPYSYVTGGTCRSLALSDNSISYDISRGVKCEGGIAGGIYTPLEFIKKKKGDCDSRTLLIFTILRHFGYDVVILNSNLYAHSIIGLNIPYSGRYKYYKGKRYYTWETTSTGFDLGVLPSSVSDINYWYVGLL